MKSTNQTQFLKKSNKKILPCSQTDQEKKRDKAQIAKIRNEREDSTTNLTKEILEKIIC